MSAIIADEPRLIHSIPGRIRVQLPGWSGQARQQLEARLRQTLGVQRAQANPLTSNALIQFDPAVTDPQAILRVIRTLDVDTAPISGENAGSEGEQKAPSRPRLPHVPHVMRARQGQTLRARVAMRGLDRDPDLARRVVERLERWPGVRAHASSLTGRVLVEFTEHEVDLEDLISEISGMELPDLPGETNPEHPLDPAPLIQSASRAIGATLGLGILATRRAFGIQEPVIPGFGTASAVISLLQGIPFVRNSLRQLLGRNLADLVLTAPGILTLTLSSNPLGLALTASEAVRILTEIMQRRSSWQQHEERMRHAPSARPGRHIRLEAGERTPREARVLEGTGTATGRDGLPVPAAPGETIPVGAQVFGGPFVLELQAGKAFKPKPRPVPVAKSLYDRYLQVQGPFSLAYAAATAILTRSPSRTLAALLLVNPRPALVGLDAADLSASARAMRAGVTVVGTRQNRTIRLPDLLLIDGPRVLTERFEVIGALPLNAAWDTAEALSYAAGIAAAAGSPWGGGFPSSGRTQASDGTFDGRVASASISRVRYSLGPVSGQDHIPAALRLRYRGDYLLALRSEREPAPLALFPLRPKLAAGVTELVHTCRRHGVELALLSVGNPITAQNIARRADIPLISAENTVEEIRTRQSEGALVAFLSDNAQAAAAYAACDLGIGLTDERGHFEARADLLAPDLGAVAAIIEAGAGRELTVRDSVAFSAISNAIGAVWGFQGAPGLEVASRSGLIAALAALGDGWLRLHGGERPRPISARVIDAHPERWGRRSVESVLHALNTSEEGLSTTQALERRQTAQPPAKRHTLRNEILDQLRSPLTAVLAAGAGVSLLLGAIADIGIIGATIAANVGIGVWQAHQAGQVAQALERMGTPVAHVLRDGAAVAIPADKLVPGDVLLLSTGDRVPADARVLSAQGLEVDEAALTGESLPVAKVASGGTVASHMVLEGSDVTSGSGRAVVVAVGHQTLMGATAAALALDENKASPLGARLSRLLSQTLPLAAVGGGIVVASGFFHTRQLLPQLAIGATIAVTAVPEGLPLLASVGEAAVARRLARRQALVRRLSAVEALGRVDVACTDKTGTLTEGRLALSLVASMDEEARPSPDLSASLRDVLLTAGLASPHPEAGDVGAHPTDVAVIQGAEEVGLGAEIRAEREAEVPFDPARSFHAALVQGRLCVKGAPEALAPRCTCLRRQGKQQSLDEQGQLALLAHAHQLAEQGLRVLMVAEGTAETQVDDPQGLVALGFVGISDPLRSSVFAAVRRCQEAGVRVIMITGDHPATARSIAREAGILSSDDEIVSAPELAELQNGEIDARLAHTTVIARATPLDKLRIVESLQRQGHTIAMTGDGVNDAPALRLADVGVAIGRGGTEVARQTADVVLADDDFSTLVEALVEGRGFWQRIRRSLGLLLGGNLGELGLMVGASVIGLTAPLNARQILAVNIVTDVLPGLAVAVQQPEHRNLAALAREGTTALDTALRNDVLRRGLATAVPALAAYVISLGSATLPQARTVAFASVVANQLAQTLDAGWAEGGLTPSVASAVGGSAGLLLGAIALPPLRSFLNLAVPTPLGWALIGVGALIAPTLGRFLPTFGTARLAQPQLPAPQPRKLLPARVNV
jgi:calcium-translocating P-type ATPase